MRICSPWFRYFLEVPPHGSLYYGCITLVAYTSVSILEPADFLANTTGTPKYTAVRQAIPMPELRWSESYSIFLWANIFLKFFPSSLIKGTSIWRIKETVQFQYVSGLITPSVSIFFCNRFNSDAIISAPFSYPKYKDSINLLYHGRQSSQKIRNYGVFIHSSWFFRILSKDCLMEQFFRVSPFHHAASALRNPVKS